MDCLPFSASSARCAAGACARAPALIAPGWPCRSRRAGRAAPQPLAAARAAGLDVIVVDHHIAEPELPPAFAVINPNRVDETSPHGVLAAVGLAFLLVVGVNRALREAGWYERVPAPDLVQWLDLVALRPICDVVPLTGVNRALVAQGLEALRQRGQ